MKRKLFYITSVICLLSLTNCKKELPNDSIPEHLNNKSSARLSYSEENQLGIPFADTSTLIQLASYSDVIHYKVARYFAYMEIENSLFEPLNIQKGNYFLTERPVIIYDYDCKPKYYEFGIYTNQGQVIANVTTIAKKQASNICAFLFNNKMDYSDKGTEDYFIGSYPSPLLGTLSTVGSTPSNLHYAGHTETVTAPSMNLLTNFQNIISSMDAESQSSNSTGISDLQNQLNENTDGLSAFWYRADTAKNRIITLTDLQIIDEAQTWSGKTTAITWDGYTIQAYNSESLKKTRWAGWCGPSAIAWAYRGLYANYPKASSNYIRLRGAGDFPSSGTAFFKDIPSIDRAYHTAPDCSASISDNGLYFRLLSECPGTCSSSFRAMYEAGMNRGMKAVTGDEYKIAYCTEPHNRIRSYNLPIFEMINIGGFGGLHYLCGFGSGYERRSSGAIKSKWLLLTDDGFRIAHYGYYPYWRNQSPDPGLFYKIYK